MNKKSKIIIVILAAAILLGGVSVSAKYFLSRTKNIYTVESPEECTEWTSKPCATVSTFDDRGNKCYIARSGGDNISISCVNQKEGQ